MLIWLENAAQSLVESDVTKNTRMIMFTAVSPMAGAVTRQLSETRSLVISMILTHRCVEVNYVLIAGVQLIQAIIISSQLHLVLMIF